MQRRKTLAPPRTSTRLALGAGALLVAGCLSASTSSDLSTVQRLARAPVLARPGDSTADDANRRELERLLEAPLDAEGAVRIALVHNRELRARLHALGIARGELVQAARPANPVVELEILPERNTSYELRIEYQISSLLLAPLRHRAAAADLEAERHRLAAAVVLTGFEVRTAFLELQAAQKRLAVARDWLETFAVSREAAQALRAAGNVAPTLASTELAAHESAQAFVSRLELEAVERRERLHALLGFLDSEQGWTISSELPELPESLPDLARAESQAIEASHEVAAIESHLEGIAGQTRLTRARGWLPDLTVDLHVLRGSPDDGVGAAGDIGQRFGGGLSLSLPLFDREQGTIVALEAAQATWQERKRGLIIEARAGVRVARSRVISAYERARRYRDLILPAQREATEHTLLQLNAMQIGVFELLRARRAELDAELAHIDTLKEFWAADAAIRALLEGSRMQSLASMTPTSPGNITDSQGEH